MRRAAKVDTVQAEIIGALRACGWTVKDTSKLGEGFPDAIATRGLGYVHAQGKECYTIPADVRLLEFKTGKGKLTKAQEAFHREWPVIILRSVDDAIKLR